MKTRGRILALAVAALLGWSGAGCATAPEAPRPDGGVVLLGETHDRVTDHHWQLQRIAALHEEEPGLAIGLEMLPRSRQAALDAWVAGTLDEAGFRREADWDRSWGFDFGLYRPIFAFARMHRIPLIALNVDRTVVRAVGKDGWAALQAWPDLDLGRPVAPSPNYNRMLAAAFAGHGRAAEGDALNRSFRRFVEVQLLWDRAMAARIAEVRAAGTPLVVVLAGSGHVRDGIPRQLRDLGYGSTSLVAPGGERGS
ncbi:ChaN family lipoprotein [Inquilinus limosus]|uniref:ChaN family lipoprotein n=1 Tax=Inquilinus limosus TaxID=171674 RepID=UPI003F14FBD6